MAVINDQTRGCWAPWSWMKIFNLKLEHVNSNWVKLSLIDSWYSWQCSWDCAYDLKMLSSSCHKDVTRWPWVLPGEQWSVWSGEEGGAGWGREEITLEHLLSHVTTSTIINNIFTSHQCSASKKYFRNYHRYLTSHSQHYISNQRLSKLKLVYFHTIYNSNAHLQSYI